MNKAAVITTHPISSHDCHVKNIVYLNNNTFQIELHSLNNTHLNYHAGQYLKIELDTNDGKQRPPLLYSIANSFNPKQPHRLQLFIQSNSDLADKVVKHLANINKNNKKIKVTLPMGQAFLQTDLNLPHILVAAGSGISNIKCLAEEMLTQNHDATVHIYWSNKHIEDFYLIEAFQQWANEHQNLTFTMILETKQPEWQGLSGYIYEVIQRDFVDLKEAQFYLCGSPKMVYGTMDKLKPIGLKEENCYSDVFEYASRS